VESSEIIYSLNSNPIHLLTFTELFRRLMSSAKQVIRLTNQSLTNQEETPLSSYRIVAARTAGRGRDEAQSLAATVRQRRPSDQLTPSHRLDGDARERQHVSPFTANSGRHTVQQRHTLGRQLVSSPVRQLRLTLKLTVRQPR